MLTHYRWVVAETRKVQVTLDEEQYAAVSRISRRDGRKLAAVVREAVEEYCVAPEARQRRLDAIDTLYSLDPAPVPVDQEQWEREYSRVKTGHATGCVPTVTAASRRDRRDDERS